MAICIMISPYVFASLLLFGHGFVLQDAPTDPPVLSDHSEILHLKSLVHGLIVLTQSMQSDIASNTDEIQELKADFGTLNISVHVGTSMRAMFDRRLRDLDTKQRSFTSTTDLISEDLTRLQQQMGQVQTDLATDKQIMLTQFAQFSQSEKQERENHLHFLASRPKNLTDNDNSQVILFSTVSGSNVSYYDVTSGKFTAPWKGAYWFGMTITASTSESIFCNIISPRYGTPALRTIGVGDTISDHVAISLEVGDKVTVQCLGYGNLNPVDTSFSGFFINSE